MSTKNEKPNETPEPTTKQRRYVKERVAGKSKAAAAREAGYADSTANHAKESIESSPVVKKLFTDLLEQAGISDELLAHRLYQGLFAMETKVASEKGSITDRVHLVAFGERRAMLELVLKLKGHLIDKHELRMVRTLEDILEDSHGSK